MRNLKGSLFSLPLSLLALLALGCGIGHSQSLDSTDGGASDGGVSSVDASACDPAHCPTPPSSGLPPDPGGAPPVANAHRVLAIRTLYFGDRDSHGALSPTAWKSYGLDIDGRTTTIDSDPVCAPSLGASRAFQQDGANGIDNSFGANILPILLTTAGSDWPNKANDALDRGADATTILAIDGLGTGSSYSPLSGALFTSVPLASPPAWNGSDVFDADSRSAGGSIAAPLTTFSNAYVNGGVFVSRVIPKARIALPLFGSTDPIEVSHLQITGTIDVDGGIHGGILSGVIATDELILQMRNAAGRISTSLCSASAFESIADQIRTAQDILVDGSIDPTRACDGISFGLGFDAQIVALGGISDVLPPPSPCTK